MRADIERWNAKYKTGNPNPDFEPDPILLASTSLLGGRGNALDLACGVGHNAIFLARNGYDVLAVDGSLTALRYCQAALQGSKLPLLLVAADLERFVLPPDLFDVVLVIRYLSRPLFPRLKRTSKPGGLIIYKTYNINYLHERPTFHEEYLLKRGELAKTFDDFDVIATNDSPRIEESMTYWIGRRPVQAA